LTASLLQRLGLMAAAASLALAACAAPTAPALPPGIAVAPKLIGEETTSAERPAFGDDFQVTGELAEAGGGIAAEIVGVGMEGVAEGDDDMGVAAGGEDAFDFAHEGFGVFGVFEDIPKVISFPAVA
jgi:hypothetical protein